jgi:hypothetical protein
MPVGSLAVLVGGILLAVGPAASAAPVPRAKPPLNISLIPLLNQSEFGGAYALRFGELFNTPEMAGAAEQINDFLATKLKSLGVPVNFPVRVQDIEQLGGRVFLHAEDKPPPNRSLMGSLTAVRMKKAHDWGGFIRSEMQGARELRYKGESYYEKEWDLPTGAPGPFPLGAYALDERTIIVEAGDGVKELIDARQKPMPKPAWADEWKEVEGGLFALVLSDPKHHYAAQLARVMHWFENDREAKEHAELELRFARHFSRFVLGLDVGEMTRLQVRFTCDDDECAKQVEGACQEVVKYLRDQAASGPDPAKADSPSHRALILIVRDLIASTAVKRTGCKVVVTAESKVQVQEVLPALLQGATWKDTAPQPEPLPPPPPLAPPPGRFTRPSAWIHGLP